jgi:serine/threonine-protein kinase
VGSEHRPLDELADAVLDGQSVNWASAESSASTPQREAIRQLRILAGIAALHRSLPDDPSGRRPSPATAPKHWGRLDLLERIGAGSFGEVYRAWDSKLDREVAVKLLRADGTRPEGATALREARLLARVRHPNVVTVYDADEIDGRVGLWMEFVHGRDLGQILKEHRTLDDAEVTRIGIELCRALSAVHGAGLLHRDIKAQNMMQTDDGRLVLMDFGTGRELEASSATILDAAGTPLYLAPEIFSGAPATVQSDIYSAGVLLFHLLTGGYPVRGASAADLQAAHARGQRVEMTGRRTRPLAAAIGRALEREPSRRFPSAAEMLATLESARRAADTRRRKQAAVGTGVAIFAAAGVFVASGAMHRGSGRDGHSGPVASAYFGSNAQKRAVQAPGALAAGIPSPDGRFFPYSQLGSGNLALYEFETGASRVLTSGGDGGDENYASESIVSADSNRIAFSWEDGACGCAQLKVIDAAGGSPRVLYGGKGSDEIIPREWSDDGDWILGTRRRDSGESEILLVSVADGSVRTIRTVKSGLGRVALSPDGRWIAYDRSKVPNAADHGLFSSKVDGGEETSVMTGPASDTSPLWTSDGSALVFASTRTGSPGLWLQPIKDGRADGNPRLLDKDMGIFGPVTLTRRGSLFFDHRTGLMDVYTAPIDPATGEVVSEPTNLATHFQGSNIGADWSPDGETLAFASWRTSRRNIVVIHSVRTGLEREFELDGVANGLHWSPDGRMLKVGGGLVDPETGKFVPADHSEFGSPGSYYPFVWDPDGRHAYLIRRDPQRITKTDVFSGEDEVLYEPPQEGVLGGILSVSPDGRWVASSIALPSAKVFRLILIPTSRGAARNLLEIPATNNPGPFAAGGWTRDGRRIFFVQTTKDASLKHYGELWIASVDGGPPRNLGLKMRALRDVRVSPDGTRIAFTSGYPETDLWVFENFLPNSGSR